MQNTSYEMRISDCSSDVCSSDLLQYLRDLGMRLRLLHLLERGDMRVAMVEPGHEAERDLPVRLLIEEAAAIGILVQRPTLGVDHPALRVFLGVDVPQFLDAQAIDLRFAIGVERELRLQDRKSTRLNSSH